MTEKLKKVDREYCLSDSTVNCYGYRLLTSGYQLQEYAKNPIGYYMHDRDGGVVVRWEELRIDGDCVYGKPCVNLSNQRGQQTLDEVESGFLNAASVGHIVVIEYSMDAADMLPGQTGPTITKWHNRECSLVDIPGNHNALGNLYDHEGNSLELCANGLIKNGSITKLLDGSMKNGSMPARSGTDGAESLNGSITPRPEGSLLNSSMDLEDVVLGVHDLVALADKGFAVKDAGDVLALIDTLKATADAAELKLKALETAAVAKEIDALICAGKDARKLTVEMANNLAADYAGNPAGLKKMIDAMPVIGLVTDLISRANEKEANWTWDDYERNDPSGKKLKALMTDSPAQYRVLFDERFKE